MKLERALLMFNLLLILVSVAAHEIGAEQYFFLLATVGVLSAVWILEERGTPFRIKDGTATIICAAAFGVMMLRGLSSSVGAGISLLDVRVPAIGEFLIVFQWVGLVRRKAPRDYFWMYLVSVIHMGTAGLLMPGVGYAFFFLSYTVVGLCALAVFHFWVEVHAREDRPREVRLRTVIGASLPATLLLLVPLALVFAMLPRRPATSGMGPQLVRLNVQPVAGFSETVRLGEIGTIQNNATRVMRVTLRDAESGAQIEEPGLLLRGTALGAYYRDPARGWTWDQRPPDSRPEPHIYASRAHDTFDVTAMYAGSFPAFATTPPRRIVHCDITLEPLRRRLFFVPFAPATVTLQGSSSMKLVANTVFHDIAHDQRSLRTPLNYSVVSYIFEPEPAEGLRGVNVPEAYLNPFLQLPPELSARVRQLARSIAPDAAYPSDYAKAERIRAYLSDSDRFTYTLTMQPTPGVEPVEDFLFNRHTGHCEYFASAMVVLLRASGVPARLVNGFKASEFNPIGGYYIVRQENAHSWAEAYLRPGGWRTYDPSVMRDEATPRPLFVRRWGRNIVDTLERVWVTYVLTYDADIQTRIYTAVAHVLGQVRNLWTRAFMLAGGNTLALHSRQIKRLLGRMEGPARVVIMGMLVFSLTGLLYVIIDGIVRWVARRRRDGPAVLFYARMERFLARRGFQRRAWQTVWEFHDELAERRWPRMEPVRLITERFCLARYARASLSAVELSQVEQALRDLKQ